MGKSHRSEEVKALLDSLGHPLREEIEYLREVVLSARHGLTEGVKWNGPNYQDGDEDRITMRIHPEKQLQLIFHLGAKVKEQPEERMLKGSHPFLTWKENDRAIATFRNMEEIRENAPALEEIIDQWIEAARKKAD